MAALVLLLLLFLSSVDLTDHDRPSTRGQTQQPPAILAATLATDDRPLPLGDGAMTCNGKMNSAWRSRGILLALGRHPHRVREHRRARA